MEDKKENKELLRKVDNKKRKFLKRLILASAFAIPVINSFSLNHLREEVALAGGGACAPG